jgi:phosphoribosylamine--glycine ligase
MNVLIVGSGAREHALAWKLRADPGVDDLFVAPGNGGTGNLAVNLAVNELDFEGLLAEVRRHHVELVVVGPEAPLAAGVADFFRERGIAVYGPSRVAAQIEASKAWAKALMQRHGIPTAAARTFDDAEAARRFIETCATPPVIKADGLAAGKGVVVAESLTEALNAVDEALVQGAFGASGRRILVEERMNGPEVSAHAICDGVRALPLPFACDHKPVLDGDRGPNTGGMGAYSPTALVEGAVAERIFAGITQATVDALRNAGAPYQGTLYPGLMLTGDGPRVVEFNCRFGDPETQVLLPRLRSHLLPALLGAAQGDLAGLTLDWDEAACVGVVMASGGYPGPYETGKEIAGLESVDDDVQVFHAGTAARDGRVFTAGGRVLTVVARGATIAAARRRAYENVRRIRFDGAHYRTDIGLREQLAAARR